MRIAILVIFATSVSLCYTYPFSKEEEKDEMQSKNNALITSLYAMIERHGYLVCPPSNAFGPCVELCPANGCPKGQLCCSNGCGHQCVDGVPSEIARNNALISSLYAMLERHGSNLVCPPPTDSNGLCVELCPAYGHCPTGQLCCSNGCGHQCMDGVPSGISYFRTGTDLGTIMNGHVIDAEIEAPLSFEETGANIRP